MAFSVIVIEHESKDILLTVRITADTRSFFVHKIFRAKIESISCYKIIDYDYYDYIKFLYCYIIIRLVVEWKSIINCSKDTTA